MELYGYDEERGLSQIILEKGTKIEIPIKDEHGAKTWIAGVITSTQAGSLDFPRQSNRLGHLEKDKEQSRNGSHMASSPGAAETATVSTYHTHYTRVLTMAPPSSRVTLAPTPTSRGLGV